MMDRLRNLKRRYFPSSEEEEEMARAEAEHHGIMRGKILGFVTHEYAEEFKQWIKGRIRAAEPKPGDHATMLYQSGVRDGLRMVHDEFDRLLDSCREN